MTITQFPQNRGNLWDMVFNPIYAGSSTSTSVATNSTLDLTTITGKGILTSLSVSIYTIAPNTGTMGDLGIELVIDGQVYPMHAVENAVPISVYRPGRTLRTVSTEIPFTTQDFNIMQRFSTNIVVRCRNFNATSSRTLSQFSVQGVYYS